MNFEFDNNIPIYIQLVDNIKKYIVSGALPPGSKLQSVRELASMAKVNPNTMQKALGELESIGLIYTERTNGKYITKDKNIINKIKLGYASDLINTFLTQMGDLGYTKEETIAILSEKKGK